MRTGILCILCLCVLALASGCSPARSGLSGNTLSTNRQPTISVSVSSDLTPAAAGRRWLTMPATNMTSYPTGDMHYAIFSEGGSGLVQRHAHVFLTRLEDPVSWRFQPDSWFGGEAGLFTTGMDGAADGYPWIGQTIAASSEGDWLSAFWLANGRDVPEKWLARRWSALLNDWVKAVREYREPWPACLDETDAKLLLLTPEAGECLRAFSDRANSVFSSTDQYTPLPDSAFLPATMPDTRFNVLKLIGEVVETGADGGDVYD